MFDYINKSGLGKLEHYNYKGKKKICLKKNYLQRFKKKIYYYFVRNPVELIIALNKGPVAIIHHANKNFKSYSGGIFNDRTCRGKLNHSSLAVGYDFTGEEPYLICKNSWSQKWGIKGYYKLALGDVVKSGKGFCNLFSHHANVVPLLKY